MSDHDGVEPVPEASSPSRLAPRRVARRAGPRSRPPAADVLVSRASAQGAKPGTNLIGKLEGRSRHDPARYPKAFKEAPQLAELVRAGKLPPVQERIGQDRSSSSRCARSASTADLAARFTGPFDTSNGPPRRPERQAALLRLHGHQARAQHRPRLGGQPDGKVTTCTCAAA